MKIVSVILAETPASSEMFLRPFKVKWDDSYVGALLESTNDGTNLSAGAIQNVANSMLAPAAESIGRANIANGFGTERLTITMVVETENLGGRAQYEVLTGYSDYTGMSDGVVGGMNGMGGHARYDPEMRFFFNTVANLTFTDGFGGNGYGSYQYSNPTQILTPVQGWSDQDQVPMINRGMVSARPKDVLANLGNGALMGAASGPNNMVPVITNTTYNFTNRVKRSSRNNNVASEYLSRVLTGYRDTMLSGDTDDRSSIGGLQAAAESPFINEPLSASSAILVALGRRTGFQQEWSVTWRELCSLDPTLPQRVQPIKMAPAYRQTANSILADSAGWQGGLYEHQVAQQTTLVMPAFMAKFALGRLHFTAHAETLDGSCHVDILNVLGAAKGIDPKAILGMIRQQLAFEVFPQLTQAGRIGLYINADISINGTSTIKVRVNGGIETPFVAPTYCDSVYSPCVAPGIQFLDGLSFDLGNAASQLTAAAMNSGPGIILPNNMQSGGLNYGQNTGIPLNLNQGIKVPGIIPSDDGGRGF